MTPRRIEVSVIICVRNGAGTLRAQLEALAAQVAAPCFEVLVVDNGSEDSSPAVAREWIKSGIGSAESARIIDATDRVGICHARNVGARLAVGPVLAYCDADDVVAPTWLAGVMTGVARGHHIVTGHIYRMTESGQPTNEVLMASPDGIHTAVSPFHVIPFAWGCNFAVTAEAFAQVGGFDEGLPPYGCDDLDFGIRLARQGLELGYVPEMAVSYRRTRGVWQRARRQVRRGFAQACLWDRHPDVYGPLPSQAGQIRELLVSPLGIWMRSSGSIQDRGLATILAASHSLGTMMGMRRWVRGGLLGPRPRPVLSEGVWAIQPADDAVTVKASGGPGRLPPHEADRLRAGKQSPMS